MVAHPPHAAGNVKRGYVIITAMVDGPWTRADGVRGWQQHVQNTVSMCTVHYCAVNDYMCWYNKTNSNMNSNFTKFESYKKNLTSLNMTDAE